MEMSKKDRLIIAAIMAIGTIINLLIAYDPFDILDTSQKVIIAVIVTAVLFPLLLYHRQRIVRKMKKIT